MWQYLIPRRIPLLSYDNSNNIHCHPLAIYRLNYVVENHIDCLTQDCINFNPLAIESLQSCAESLICISSLSHSSTWFFFKKDNNFEAHVQHTALLWYVPFLSLQWRHNGCDGVLNHQPHHCLLSRLFRRRSMKTSKLRVTGLCAGNSPVTGEFPAQMASNAENVSIWWRHHVNTTFIGGFLWYIWPSSSGSFYWHKGNYSISQEICTRFCCALLCCMQSFIMNSHAVFIHIHQGCFAGTGAIVRLPQCQWSKPDRYGKISQCITTTKHSKAKTVCIFLVIYCIWLIVKNLLN